METSPLRFLDMDVSLMLADQVRISQEEEARKFHSENFENSHENDLNHENHYLMSNMFEEIGYLLKFPVLPPPGMIIATHLAAPSLRLPYFLQGRQDLSLRDTHTEISILDFKRCYDVCSNVRIKNTRLQRCGYTSIYEYY